MVGVLPSHALSLGCCNVDTSMGFCNLGGLRNTLEYLEYGGHVCRWRSEDFVAVVVEDELILKVPGPWWRSTPLCNPRVATLAVVEIFFALADPTFALVAPVQPILYRASCSNKTIQNASKHNRMHQNMSLGPNKVDRVHSL